VLRHKNALTYSVGLHIRLVAVYQDTTSIVPLEFLQFGTVKAALYQGPDLSGP
jgi:hypothetical protein